MECFSLCRLDVSNGNLYLCNIEEIQIVSPWPERRATQKLTTMKTDNKTPMRDLEYQIKRYQTMGNGAACQQLRNEMQRRQDAEA